MSTDPTLARPYADAIFKRAVESESLDQWSGFLTRLNMICADPITAELIADPKQNIDIIEKLILDLLEPDLNDENRNCLSLISKNKRLEVVSEIYRQFERHKSSHTGILDVEIYSAFEMTKYQTDSLQSALEIKFKSKVKITTQIDKSLIGGVIIKAGDIVIDNSVKNQIHKIANSLNS